MKTEALAEQAKSAKPVRALTVYPPNTPVKLVPKALTKEIKVTKAIFDELEAEVGQHAVNRKYRTLDFRALGFQITQLTKKVSVLQEQNDLFKVENAKVKQHYKELYDSIKITRAKYIDQTTALLTENENLKVQINAKKKYVTIDSVTPKVLAPGMYAIDVEPIPPCLRINKEVHLDYLKNLKESIETLREIVEEAKATTLLTRKKQVTFMDQCETSNNNTHNHVEQQTTQKTYVPMIPSIGVNSCTDTSRSKPRSNTKKNKIMQATSVNRKTVEDHPRTNKYNLQKPNRVDSGRTDHPFIFGLRLLKHMTWDHSRLKNFMKKFTGTVRFRNDYFGAIMGYGDYVIGDSVISRVYYVEGLGHNLFSVGQFCDFDLEVAFRKHSCYVRDTNGVELIKGSYGSNLYTISVEDMMNSSLICLLSKASKTKSWLWHRCLKHLNFSTINKLARKDLVRGLPRLEFENDHLCSAWLVSNQVPASPYVPPTNKALEILFQPMFNECLEPPRVEKPISLALAVLVPVNSASTSSSTSIDQDAPSPSHSPSSSALKSPCLHQGVVAEYTLMDKNPFAPVDNDPFINIFALEPTSEASSSRDASSTASTYVTQALHHLRK
nr:integrase, catalytic region, zinc finger, CCHC-type, peptidase aspartic, catalytic [Tanacetum cinerariifolium]